MLNKKLTPEELEQLKSIFNKLLIPIEKDLQTKTIGNFTPNHGSSTGEWVERLNYYSGYGEWTPFKDEALKNLLMQELKDCVRDTTKEFLKNKNNV